MVLMDAGRAVEAGNLQGAIAVRSHGVGMPVVVEEGTEVAQSKSRGTEVSGLNQDDSGNLHLPLTLAAHPALRSNSHSSLH